MAIRELNCPQDLTKENVDEFAARVAELIQESRDHTNAANRTTANQLIEAAKSLATRLREVLADTAPPSVFVRRQRAIEGFYDIFNRLVQKYDASLQDAEPDEDEEEEAPIPPVAAEQGGQQGQPTQAQGQQGEVIWKGPPATLEFVGDARKLKALVDASLAQQFDHLVAEMKKKDSYVRDDDPPYVPDYEGHATKVVSNKWKAMIARQANGAEGWHLHFTLAFNNESGKLTVKVVKVEEGRW